MSILVLKWPFAYVDIAIKMPFAMLIWLLKWPFAYVDTAVKMAVCLC
jgi:hypothetical protein